MAQQVNVKILAVGAGSAISLTVEIRNLASDPAPFVTFTETIQLPTTVVEAKARLRDRIAEVVREFNESTARAARGQVAAAAVNGTQYDLVI